MTQAELRAEIKNGPCGGYLIFGDEEYLRDFYISRIRSAVLGEDETVAAFNRYKLRVETDGVAELESALLSAPLMSDKILIEVYADMTKVKNREELVQTLSEADYTWAVLLFVPDPGTFDAGNLKKNKPSALYKQLCGPLKPVCLDMQTPAELKKWIERRLARTGVTALPGAQELLLEKCGREMYRLSGELDKLVSAAGARNTPVIDEALVAEIVCESEKDDAFALANAVMNGDRKTALEALAGYKRRREAAAMVLGSVSKCIGDMLCVSELLCEGADKAEIADRLKLHTYKAGLYISAVRDKETGRIRAALQRCREADVLMKTTRLDYIALERLICTIPSRGRAQRR